MNRSKLKSLLVGSDLTIKQAMQKLNDTAAKILFVVDNNEKLLGTVTDGDIRRSIIDGLQFSDHIENVMYRDFRYVRLSGHRPKIEEYARNVMKKEKLDHVPVLDTDGVIVDVIMWLEILEESETSIPPKSHPNQVVLMAGGMGTRLAPFTKIFPKPLIPIGNRPVIDIIMENFYKSGFHKFIYTLNYKKEYIKLFLRESAVDNYDIDWIEEDDFMGTVGSISLLKEKINDTFFVVNCDSLLETDFGEILKWHKEHQASITIVGCYNEIKIPFGVLELSGGRLEKISEKPAHDVIINTGIYVFEPHIIEYINDNEKLDMNCLIDRVKSKEKVSVFSIYSGWFDIGQWEEYKKSIDQMEY